MRTVFESERTEARSWAGMVHYNASPPLGPKEGWRAKRDGDREKK